LRRGPRRRRPITPENEEIRVNRRIHVPRVLVIDEEGERLGEFMTRDAVALAEERGLDLVEVSPNARPPVCKITDYGRMKYDKKRREAQARKNQVKVELKEVKLRPKTDEHDMNVKIGHARRFLLEGNKVKVTLRFRGREHAHRDIGAGKCLSVAKAVEECGAIEIMPRMEGRQMFMILAPTRKIVKPKPKPVEDRPANPSSDDESDEPAADSSADAVAAPAETETETADA